MTIRRGAVVSTPT